MQINVRVMGVRVDGATAGYLNNIIQAIDITIRTIFPPVFLFLSSFEFAISVFYDIVILHLRCFFLSFLLQLSR